VQQIEKCEWVHTSTVLYSMCGLLQDVCVSNTQLKHDCEIKYFGTVKVQTARGFELCRLTVRQIQITISAVEP